jgi:hypothetical protein
MDRVLNPFGGWGGRRNRRWRREGVHPEVDLVETFLGHTRQRIHTRLDACDVAVNLGELAMPNVIQRRLQFPNPIHSLLHLSQVCVKGSNGRINPGAFLIGKGEDRVLERDNPVQVIRHLALSSVMILQQHMYRC